MENDAMIMEQGDGQPAGEGTAENGSGNFEMDLYTLQFRWIPSLIDAVVKGNLPCQALADVPWWEKCLKEQGMTKADFSFEEIKAEVKKISEEKGRICLTFPYPKRAPLAKYAVIDLLASGGSTITHWKCPSMTHGCLDRRMFTGTATSVRCLIARRWRILRGRLIDLVMLINLTSAPLLKERELYGDASDLAMMNRIPIAVDFTSETLDWWRQSVTFTPDEYESVLSRDMEP